MVHVILALKSINYSKHSYVWACIRKGAVKIFLKSLVLRAVICVAQKWVPLTCVAVAISGNKHNVEGVLSL